jgi:hypothetical protein
MSRAQSSQSLARELPDRHPCVLFHPIAKTYEAITSDLGGFPKVNGSPHLGLDLGCREGFILSLSLIQSLLQMHICDHTDMYTHALAKKQTCIIDVIEADRSWFYLLTKTRL